VRYFIVYKYSSSFDELDFDFLISKLMPQPEQAVAANQKQQEKPSPDRESRDNY
jgi:hypothetical protein